MSFVSVETGMNVCDGWSINADSTLHTQNYRFKNYKYDKVYIYNYILISTNHSMFIQMRTLVTSKELIVHAVTNHFETLFSP